MLPRLAAAFAAPLLLLGTVSPSHADDISNSLDDSIEATAESMSLNVGGSVGKTNLFVSQTNGDGKNGCNLTGNNTGLTVSIVSSNTAVATVSPSSVTFTSCSDVHPVTVTPVKSGSSAISLTQTANSTGGTFNLAPAAFNVTVAPPANTAPSVTVDGVTASANYQKDSVPTATCKVTDAQDGPSSFPATLSAVTGPNSAQGVGSQTARCSYTDAGGLTATASVTYNIVPVPNTAPTVKVTGVAGEAKYEVGSVPTAGCAVTDAETADPVVPNPTLSPVSGSLSDHKLGKQTATCTYTDPGGLTGSATAEYSIVDTTRPVLKTPGDITLEATDSNGAEATWDVSATDNVALAGPATCSPASPRTFDLGTHTVDCSATDVAGNTATGSFKVTVNDTKGPSLKVSADVTVEATGPDGAKATYDAPTASDVRDGTVSASCSPASGSTFKLGTTTVTCTATDKAGNESTGSFEVKVVDTTTPEVDAPGNETAEATGPNGATVSFPAATATDLVDGTLTPTCAPDSGSTFKLGTTTVTCTATDKAGNTGSDSFEVKVVDTTAPAVTVPADITEEATSDKGAPVSFTTSATDIVDGTASVTCDHQSGDTFPLGATEVKCSSTDETGNTGSESFTVTVQDKTAPVVTVPENNAVEATGPNGATASFSTSATDAVDGTTAVTCAPKSSGDTFPLGATEVKCSSTDKAGNTASESFTVTVQDKTAPVLKVPADITEEATSGKGATVSFATSATDIVDGTLTPACTPDSGSTFPVGTTTVTCEAIDEAGNKDSKSFKVTVQDKTAPKLSLPANITTGATSAAGASVTYSASATDLVDGSAPVNCSSVSGSTFAPGTTTVSCTATDAAGNQASGIFTVKVSFAVKGFYSPVDMGSNVYNTVKGGSTVPLKFEIFAGANEQTSTAVIKEFKTQKITCTGAAMEDAVEVTTTGGTSLRYDSTAGQFIQNWKTPTGAGSCYSATMTAADGSVITAFFKLK